MTKVSQYRPWNITPGVQPSTDKSAFATQHYVAAQAMRSVDGQPQKIGGWQKILLYGSALVSGVVRSIFSMEFNDVDEAIIGTNSNLYSLIGNQLTNITPFSTVSVAASNSLSTQYGTLTNPIYTTNGSGLVRVLDPSAARYRVNDFYTLAGSSAVGGIPAANINARQVIRAISGNYVTIHVATSATSTANGGGGTVTRSSGLITLTAANSDVEGGRVEVQGAAAYNALSASIAAPGTGYQPFGILVVQGGTYSSQAQFNITSVKAISGTINTAQSGAGSYAPGNTLALSGGTGTSPVFTIATTHVQSATVAAGGTGGVVGTQTVTGTTGTGTKFQASVEVNSSGVISSVNSISLIGSYTVNPTTLTAEPVTGGGVTGATLNIVMGVDTITLTSGGSYTALPTFPAATTTSGSGTGATLTAIFGLNSVSLGSAGAYSIQPTNPVTTTSSNGSGSQLTVTYTGGSMAGLTAAQLNGEFISRNVTPAAFDYMTFGTATSAVTGGGGTGTIFYQQVSAGNVNEISTSGYGAGLYGVGLYGTALQSTSGRTYPRIWFIDRFGNNAVMTAGNQTPVYQWAGATATAPVIVSGAPTAVNYAFVSDNVLVTLGANGIENQIYASDVGNITQWVASSSNAVYQLVVQGAGRFVSQVPVSGKNLLFTPFQTYSFRFIGGQLIWDLQQVDPAIGIIAPMARVSVHGIAYWMGDNNFYFYRGDDVEIIPANSQAQSTLHNYVFNNINRSQASKCFAWYNPRFSEVWFHYPSAASNECDSIARVNVNNLDWWPDKMDRTAAEYPNIGAEYPRVSDSASLLYFQELGNDADTLPLPWNLTSPFVTGGKTTGIVSAVIPDSMQTGNISLAINAKRFPQSLLNTSSGVYTITPTTEEMPVQIGGGRLVQYTLSGNSLNQQFRMGQWMDDYQASSER